MKHKKVIPLCSVNEIIPRCTVEQIANMIKHLSTVYRISKYFCRQSFDMISIDLVPCVYSL